jgi:nucleoid DNA-binding protein
MEKKHIIRFLKKGKRGSYTWLVRMYSDLFTSMSTTMALELVEEDLNREEKIELNYFSVAKAVARFKKETAGKNPNEGNKKQIEFRDGHEISNGQLGAGQFKI